MGIVIQNGILVSGEKSYKADIRIVGEQIAKVEKQITANEDETVIDVAGKLIFPGFIDGHTHLDMDSGTTVTADDFYTGTKAALMGGTTMVIDFATQEKGNTLNAAFFKWMKKAEGKSSCDFGFHMAIVEWKESVKAELKEMTALGVSSFKIYLAYDNLRVNDAAVYEILQEMKQIGGLVGVHCENGDLVNIRVKQCLERGETEPKFHAVSRPDSVEAEAIARLLYIAKLADCSVHIVHLSTKEGLSVIRHARENGQKVQVETCPQYLLLQEECYQLPGFEGAKYVCSPPLRTDLDREALWQGIAQDEIQTVSTDHCCYRYQGQKDMGKEDFSKIPNGLPGIEHRPQLLYTFGVLSGKISKEKMCQILSENNAKVFGCYPQKGAILPGSDADLVIWSDCDENITVTNQLMNADYTPYEGFHIRGKPEHVFLRGQQVVKDAEIVLERQGKYVKRNTSCFPQ